MARKTSASRNAAGAGSIRRKVVHRNWKNYIYREASCTVGYAPGTGKQQQRSITRKTQREVMQKLRQITLEIDQGIYHEPNKMTVGQWLDVWTADYLGASSHPPRIFTGRMSVSISSRYWAAPSWRC